MIYYNSILRINRLINNVSLSKLATDSKLDVSSLSRLENNNINSSQYYSAFSALNIDMNDIETAYIESDKLLQDILNITIKSLPELDNIKDSLDAFNHSLVTIEYCIAKMIFCIYKHISIEESLITSIEKSIDSSDTLNKKVFCIYVAIYYEHNENHYKAYEYLHNGISISVNNDLINAFNYYMLGNICIDQCRFLQASNLLNKAIVLFNNNYIYKRVGDVLLSLAALNTAAADYDTSRYYYKSATDLWKQVAFRTNIFQLYQINILNILVEEGNYLHFLDMYSSLPEDIRSQIEHSQLFVLDMAISLYKTQQFNDCLKYISKAKQFVTDKEATLFIEFLSQKLTSKKNYLEPLRKAYRHMRRTGNFSYFRMIFSELLELEHEANNRMQYYEFMNEHGLFIGK